MKTACRIAANLLNRCECERLRRFIQPSIREYPVDPFHPVKKPLPSPTSFGPADALCAYARVRL